MKKLPFKKVNYIVKSPCGDYEKGEVISAYLLLEGGDARDIVYLPPEPSKGYCGCVILCEQNSKGEYCEISEKAFMNCPNLAKLKKTIVKL